MALFWKFGRQSRYGLGGVRVGEASHPGPRESRESTDDELPLVQDRHVIPWSARARDVTGSVAAARVDSEMLATPSQVVETTPIAFRWNAARFGVCADNVLGKHRTQAHPTDGGQRDQLRDGTSCKERDRLKWIAKRKTTSEHHSGGSGECGGECVQTAKDVTRAVASTLEGDARCSSPDATTVAASSNAVSPSDLHRHRVVNRRDRNAHTRLRSTRTDFTKSSSDPSSRPDSHDERLDRVRNDVRRDRRTRMQQTATNFLLGLARRAGPSSGVDDIPREIRRQQWSVFNVPLMWSAADWITHRAEQCPRINICGVEMGGGEAIQAGWEVLRHMIESVGIRSREDLAEWIHSEGFPQPRWGEHFSGRVQERIFNMAIVRDARAVAFESVYVHIAVHA